MWWVYCYCSPGERCEKSCRGGGKNGVTEGGSCCPRALTFPIAPLLLSSDNKNCFLLDSHLCLARSLQQWLALGIRWTRWTFSHCAAFKYWAVRNLENSLKKNERNKYFQLSSFLWLHEFIVQGIRIFLLHINIHLLNKPVNSLHYKYICMSLLNMNSCTMRTNLPKLLDLLIFCIFIKF